MRVLDLGHRYSLDTLDGGGMETTLQFVKRKGVGYPGNETAYPGTTAQEVLRALIDRAGYVHHQIPCPETEAAIELMKAALVLFELRAARRHGRQLDRSVDEIVWGEPCPGCLHIGCTGERHS